jgi:HD-GYP domain-containing protein (c-di-GMP phosphodiesterase class II)
VYCAISFSAFEVLFPIPQNPTIMEHQKADLVWGRGKVLKSINKVINLILIFALLFSAVSCTLSSEKNNDEVINYTAYSDIPGITVEEIIGIEALQQKYTEFKYGVPFSSEAFYNEEGEIAGFAAMFCEWMSDLFGITFVPVNCEFADLFTALNTGKIDFAGGLAASNDRRKTYYMTDPIAERTLKYYYLADRKALSVIRETRPIRLAFLEDSASTDLAISLLEPGTYEPIFIKYNSEAYGLLKNDLADAFIHQNTTDVIFENNQEVITEDFFPAAFVHTSLTAQKSEYAVIISAVQKTIINGQLEYFSKMYNKGEYEYRKHKFFQRLTEEEKAYIEENPVIPLAAEYSNYPVSFYNKFENQWQGISHDVIKEIADLTGLRFEVINDPDTEWPELLKLLDEGKASVITELIYLKNREKYFIWPDKIILSDRPALISKYEYHDIILNEILYTKIGLIKNSAYADLFKKWFPHHTNNIEYEDFDSTINALINGDVDMALLTENQLLSLIHYKEMAGYKTNLVFDYGLDSTFGLNKDETVLSSIMSKSLDLIDTDKIVDQWQNKTFDYRMKVAEARRPLFISVTVLLSCVIILGLFLLIRKQADNKKLWNMKNSVINIVSDLIECRDGTTGDHVSRTQKYLECLIGKCVEKNVYTNEIKSLNARIFISSSQLHDVGKISIPDSILNKPGKLTDDEFAVMKTHTTIGVDIIKRMTKNTQAHDFFDYAGNFAESHHEKWNGSGYPNKLEGTDIPLEGRLMAIVDVYDALVSERPYKEAFSPEKAASIICKDSGSHFDPELVRMFKLIKDEFADICESNGSFEGNHLSIAG